MLSEFLLDLREAHPAWYWPLHDTHWPLLIAADWGMCHPPTQASWSLARCGQELFITSLSSGQLSQTPMVLACSSLMGSWLYVLTVQPLTDKNLLHSEGKEMYWLYRGDDAPKLIKEMEIRQCFCLAMSRHLLRSSNKFSCIQSRDTLHLQKGA